MTKINKKKIDLAKQMLKAASSIALSPEPVTEERLIVGEFFVDMAKALVRK